MSISHLYGKDSASFNVSATTTKTYIPGGVSIVSPLVTPTGNGITTGNVGAGRNLKLFYTKVGNLVNISIRGYLSNAGAQQGEVNNTFLGTEDPCILPRAAIGVELSNQLINDITTSDSNAAKVLRAVDIAVPGILVGVDGTVINLIITAAGNVNLGPSSAGGDFEVQDYQAGGISFVSENYTIL